jgi:hypothetical protein
MKIVERENATKTLAAYTAEIGSGPVVVTEEGKPVAILVLLENVDLETLGLCTNRQFIDSTVEWQQSSNGPMVEDARRPLVHEPVGGYHNHSTPYPTLISFPG